MESSTLDPDNLPLGTDCRLHQGHETGALGPRDSSDSGSDLQGAPGLAQQGAPPFETGTTSDIESSTAHNTAGPDVGDANLDCDSDSFSTVERAAAARDTLIPDGADIDVDRIDTIDAPDDDEDFGNSGENT